MFTGIITDIGRIERLDDRGDLRARIGTSYPSEGIALGSSIACGGICLTVVDRGPSEGGAWFEVDISAETVARTNLRTGRRAWQPGTPINLERALRLGDELGGHVVTGHIDGTAEVVAVRDEGDSTRVTLRVSDNLARFVAPKGSVALDGTSLTVNEVEGRDFGVNLIPHTKAVTTWGEVAVGDRANIEIDALARYVARLAEFSGGWSRAMRDDFDYAAISSLEEIIDDARNGRMFILIDHEERENEGDLIIPAQMCTPDAINFMATYGRGLICLALTGARLDALGLPLMAASNSSRHETAFTVSIEAREGVTTGISAHDRARTVSVAIDAGSGPQDIASPGHVFPLRAREGGVLVRAGHTEAAVDIARLAGLNPAGVICEIMNDDGTMARLPDLVAFAQRHNLKIGTISDLIAYRRRHDNLVRQTAAEIVESCHGGTWQLRIFEDLAAGAEHIVLTKGDIATAEPVLVRMHAVNPMEDLLGLHARRSHQLHDAMLAVAAEGRGVVVVLRDMSMKLEISDHASPHKLRQYGVGAQILNALGLRELLLLTNSPSPKVVGLDGYGLRIVGTRPIPPAGR